MTGLSKTGTAEKKRFLLNEQELVSSMTPYNAHVDDIAEITQEEFGE